MKTQTIPAIAAGGLASLLLAILFYRSLSGLIITWPAALMIGAGIKRKAELKKTEKAESELLDAVMSSETALRAGDSLETAFVYSENELERLWGEGSLLLPMWREMNRKVALKEPTIKAFGDMARESGIKELYELYELTGFAKKMSGGLAGLMNTFGEQLEQKISVEREVRAALTEKRMEKNIMLFLPPAILAYLNLTAYEWVGPLYQDMSGRIFMTAAFFCYVSAYIYGERILKITV